MAVWGARLILYYHTETYRLSARSLLALERATASWEMSVIWNYSKAVALFRFVFPPHLITPKVSLFVRTINLKLQFLYKNPNSPESLDSWVISIDDRDYVKGRRPARPWVGLQWVEFHSIRVPSSHILVWSILTYLLIHQLWNTSSEEFRNRNCFPPPLLAFSDWLVDKSRSAKIIPSIPRGSDGLIIARSGRSVESFHNRCSHKVNGCHIIPV